MTSYKTIDMIDELNLIKEKYGERFFANEEAILEAAKLWGCEVNDCGVCRPLQKETIAQVGTCNAVFSFYETSKGYWLIGLSLMTSFSGRGYAPSTWDGIGYPSYDDARLACIEKMIPYFERVVTDTSSCNSVTNIKSAKSRLALLDISNAIENLYFSNIGKFINLKICIYMSKKLLPGFIK